MQSFRQRLRELLLLLTHEGSWRRCFDRLDMDVRERSMQLLKENLSPAQRQQLESRGFFDVVGGATGHRYRIWLGLQMNVERLDKRGRREHLLCFIPEGRLPIGDVLLAQKVALEVFEPEALSIANRIGEAEVLGGRRLAGHEGIGRVNRARRIDI